MSYENQRGFTLIELMIVVTIVGILLLIAIPRYFEYATRAKASEGIALFTPAKTAVSEFGLAEGRFPDNNGEAGMDSPTSYVGNHVESVTVGPDGVVTVQFSDPALLNGTFIFTPSMVPGGSIKWVCTTTIPQVLVPAACRN